MMTGGLLTEEIISQLGGTTMPRSAGQRDKVAKRLLEDNMKSGVYTVLAIDEAHDLKEKIFISLKSLWDSGMIFKLIAIVLIGAGGRDEAGKNWGLRGMIEGNPYIKEFAERCYVVDLGKLNGNMSDYLDYRFRKVGRAASEIFTPDAMAPPLTARQDAPDVEQRSAVRGMKNAYQDGKTAVHFDHVNDA
jgi:type II secretory pathway predicted ATPase ExeA